MIKFRKISKLSSGTNLVNSQVVILSSSEKTQANKASGERDASRIWADVNNPARSFQVIHQEKEDMIVIYRDAHFLSHFL